MTRTLLALLLLLPLPAPAQNAPREALLLGSSSVNGAVGRTLESELRAWNVRLVRRARSSSGFARPDFHDWEAEVRELGSLDRYAAILLYTGGNDTQHLRLRRDERPSRAQQWIAWSEEERWRSVYRSRVRNFVDTLCARGARRVIVLLPVDGGRPGWSRRIVRVREEMQAGASHACGSAIDASTYPNETFESLDGVHLSWEGARRMWGRVRDPLRRILGV